MEKLQLKHIGPYLPYGLQVQIIETGNNRKLISVNANESVVLAADDLNPFSFPRCKPVTGIKPILRPLSDLYKEIDGKVGIVEIAKMLSGTVLVEKIDGCCTNLSYFKCTFEDGFEELIINENCEGWYRSYFDKNQPSTGRNVINQFEVFQYLFQHHYDVFSLIDKGLAIDLNSISHE